MKATVSTLYKNGKRLPLNQVGETVTGYLNLDVSKNPISGLCDQYASIITDRGHHLFPPLNDAVCASIAAHGIRLRGFEFATNGREQAQEWWCRIPAEQTKPMKEIT